ncbi:MAG: chorismate mutase [Bacteroidales bacterium]|jgi:chorismate mutase|nr:chorismate mutase [Bacteroidales bacterium]
MNIESFFSESESPLIIAGPCSAESEDQMLQTACMLTKYPQIKYFRAGIWKPRSHPGQFEGAENMGLQWLQKVKKTTRIKTCVEVANRSHVRQALDADVDLFWIGARTTVNPFLVEEIAQAMKGCNMPIMIKNPVNPDIDLWIGAIERFYKHGITKIAAIHRGFSSFHKTKYRNESFWEIVFELHRKIPNLPIITDPSHLTGNSKLVAELSQKALDLESDGLMIEVHPCPKEALSDKKQQIDFDEFDKLMKSLRFRKKSENRDFISLSQLRTQIDEIDMEIVKLLSDRMKFVSDIGKIKRQNELTILQKDRWKEVVESRLAFGEQEGLDKDFLLKILHYVHEESLRIQSDIFDRKNDE